MDGNLKNKQVLLTERGEALLRSSVDLVFRLEENASARLTEKERTALLSLRKKLMDAFRAETDHFLARFDRRNKRRKYAAIKLSDHFTYGRLLRYTLPSIIMMIFTSLYSVVDGLFVSNLVGDLALSAVNIAFPITMIVGAFGFMLGTGGSAIVARTLGEGKPELASRYFSLFIWCVAGLGVALSVVTIVFIEPIMRFAGASDLLLEDCVRYGRHPAGGQRACSCCRVPSRASSPRRRSQSWGCCSPWEPERPTSSLTMCSSPCWTWASPVPHGPRCWATAWAASSRWCTSSPPGGRACGWCGRGFTAGSCSTPAPTAPRS